MWGGAPDQRPSTQAADVTARLRPDKIALGTPLMGPSRRRARTFGGGAICAILHLWPCESSATKSSNHGPGGEDAKRSDGWPLVCGRFGAGRMARQRRLDCL